MMRMFDIIEKKIDGINLFQAIDFSVANHNTELEDLNTLQLDKGIDTEGKSLGTYKDIRYKGRIDRVDLKDEGDFRGSINAISRQGQITLTATDWKTNKLTTRYGENIIGIPRKDLENGEVKSILLEDIIIKVKEQLDGIS